MTATQNALLMAENLLPKMPRIDIPRPPNFAEYAIKAIYEEFADFEARLDADQEIGMCIVGGPTGLCFHVREVYRYGGDKLVFVGVDANSKPVRLMQHLTQLNLLMTAVPKVGPTAVRIGFHAPAEAAE